MYRRTTTQLSLLILLGLLPAALLVAEPAQCGPPEEMLAVVPLAAVEPVSLRGIAVWGEAQVWVSGSEGTLMKGTRRGRRWKSVAPPDTDELDFRDLQFLDRKTVLAMSAGPGPASRIYKTSDGGKRWRLTHRNEDPDAFFNSFAFWDETRGLITSDSGDGQLVLLRTDDAGETWRRVGQGSLPPLLAGEAGFAASGTAVATYPGGHVWVATGGTDARVFYSADFGVQWRVASTPIVRGEPGAGIFSIAFRDPLHGVIVGGNYQKPELGRGNAAWTSDGGKTWTESSVPEETGLTHKACVTHLGGTRFLAAGRLGLAYSADDGRSWQSVAGAPYFTMALNREGRAGYLAGSDGRIGKLAMRSLPRSSSSQPGPRPRP